jgi:hypothetical protein
VRRDRLAPASDADPFVAGMVFGFVSALVVAMLFFIVVSMASQGSP